MSNYYTSQVGPLADWGALDGVAPGKKFVEGELGSQFAGISVNFTQPGGATPFWHTHNTLEEIYIFLEGEGEFAVEDEVLPIHPGTIIRVGQGAWRAHRCLPDGSALKWLCVRAGGDTLENIGNDAEIDSDRPYPWS